MWFFYELVEESVIYFKCKLSSVIKNIGFPFNDLKFVIDPFQFTVRDGIITMVQDTIAILFEHLSEAVQGAILIFFNY